MLRHAADVGVQIAATAHEICDEVGGCVPRSDGRTVFPWSMSDFKPGEKSVHDPTQSKAARMLRCGLVIA